MTLNTLQTVGELVAERPSRARIFERLGIDYCCGGKKPLAEACSSKGLDADSVLKTLSAAEAVPAPETLVKPADMSLTELADHIVATHHEFLRLELPRLEHLAGKVASRHGEHHPWLPELNAVVAHLRAELEMHMMKEEQILFPMIRNLDAGREAGGPGCGLDGPIGVMESEHDAAGEALRRLRALSSDYTAPGDACNSFLALLDGLSELEADLHQHIHKENNILFPRAQERAAGQHVA